VGRLVVDRLARAGHEPVVLARSSGVDLTTGEGLAGRLDDVQAVIDVTSVGTLKTAEAVEFFGSVTSNLLAEERRAGVGHHVALSIVGIDDAESGYYAGKVEQERLVRASEVPWTILRATQFHEFAEQMLARGRVGPVVVVPRMLSAPVAASEVADLLVDLAFSEPRRDTVELSGPRQEQVVDMSRRLLRSMGSRRPVVPVTLPGAAGRAMRDGGCLPTRPGSVGTQTFEEWLAQRTG
jgi:uncharacterized protein YbjT (DUF2867 family)